MLPTELTGAMFTEKEFLVDPNDAVSESWDHLEKRLFLNSLRRLPLEQVDPDQLALSIADLGSAAFTMFLRVVGDLNFGGDIYVTNGIELRPDLKIVEVGDIEEFRTLVSFFLHYLSGVQDGMLRVSREMAAQQIFDLLAERYPQFLSHPDDRQELISELQAAAGESSRSTLFELMNQSYHKHLFIMIAEFACRYREPGDVIDFPRLVRGRMLQLLSGVEYPEYFQLMAAALIMGAINHGHIDRLLSVDWSQQLVQSPTHASLITELETQLAEYMSDPAAYITRQQGMTVAAENMSTDIDLAIHDNNNEAGLNEHLPHLEYFHTNFEKHAGSRNGTAVARKNIESANIVLANLGINFSITPIPAAITELNANQIKVYKQEIYRALSLMRGLQSEINERGQTNLTVRRATLAEYTELLSTFVVRFSRAMVVDNLLTTREHNQQQLANLEQEVGQLNADHHGMLDYFYCGDNYLNGTVATIRNIGDQANLLPVSEQAYRTELTADAVAHLRQQPELDTYATQFIRYNYIFETLSHNAYEDLIAVLHIEEQNISYKDVAQMQLLAGIFKVYEPNTVPKRDPRELILAIRKAIFAQLIGAGIYSGSESEFAKLPNQAALAKDVRLQLADALPVTMASSEATDAELADYINFRVWWEQNYEQLLGLTYLAQVGRYYAAKN